MRNWGQPRDRQPPERPVRIPLVALMAGVLVFVVAVLSYLVREPWLFASLGPSAYVYARHPQRREASTYNTVVGHFIGILSGIVVTLALHAATDLSTDLTRVFAAVLAVSLTVSVQLWITAYHAPAVSTALLFALGVVSADLYSAIRLSAGIVVLAGVAAVLTWLRALANVMPPDTEP